MLYKVNPGRSLNHDGKRYAAGAKVELSEKEGSVLVALGTVFPAKAEPKPNAKEPAKASGVPAGAPEGSAAGDGSPDSSMTLPGAPGEGEA